MKNILSDFATDIALCKTDDCAWRAGLRFFESLGFEAVTYGTLDKKNDKLLGFYSNLDSNFLAYYAGRHYDDVDPLVLHCLKNSNPVHYSYRGASQVKLTGSDKELKVLGACYEAGVHSSFVVPFHNDIFSGMAGICLAGKMTDLECRALVEAHRSEILVAGALLNSHLVGVPSSLQCSQSWFGFCNNPEGITPRETEVLKWLSQGLRNDRVAERMDVTPATINFHMGSIKKKLGARTREQALVIAMRKGIIAL
ncbi:MAG: LuxR C-terminal-related transcriptional regulator [Hyphomicrobiales bacterium]